MLGAATSVGTAVTDGGSRRGLVPKTSCPQRPAAPFVADVDGDKCSDAIAFSAGVVAVNHARFEVGKAGDQLALGRWFCGDSPTLALLRPETGQVFVFDQWPAEGLTASPTLAGVVKNAQKLTSVATSVECDTVGVSNTQGTTLLPTQQSGTSAQ